MPSNFRWTAFFIVPVKVIKDLKDFNAVEVVKVVEAFEADFRNRVGGRCFPEVKQLGHLI